LIVHVIIGPTASGKSALAVEYAAKNNGVIINADAMQCYKALPILTAQPSADERAAAPHVLYGFLNSTQAISAADWAKLAADEITKAFQNNQTPYIVGGTGLYIKALMDGLSPIPDIPAPIRQSVRARLQSEGLEMIYADLKNRDPVMASRLKAGDSQRILRAMEVLEATGKSLSEWQALPLVKPYTQDWQFHVTQLRPTPAALDARIRTRLHAMLKMGAMDEVTQLSAAIDAGHVPENAPVTIALGFQHFRKVLKGQMQETDAFEATAIESRQYTKRQRTWLRHQIKADVII
jgi:tRNA dimethylallyltransferase